MKPERTDETQDLPVRISDAVWQSILPFLKASGNVYVGNPETCRRFLSALVWMTKEGATWRARPKAYGYWNSIYRRFRRWCDAGVFQKLHEHSMMLEKSLRSSLIRRLCGLIHLRRVLRKKRRTGLR